MQLASLLDVRHFENRLNFPKLALCWHHAFNTIVSDVIAEVNDVAFVEAHLLFQVQFRTHMQNLSTILQEIFLVLANYHKLRAAKPLLVNHILIIRLATANQKRGLRPIEFNLVRKLVLRQSNLKDVLRMLI